MNAVVTESVVTAGHSAVSIGQVFRKHGIHIGIGAPIMQIQELAMAINLLGQHHVVVEYRKSIGVRHEIIVMAKPAEVTWKDEAGQVSTRLFEIIELPTRDTPEEERTACIVKLEKVREALGGLLAEGEPS